MKTRYQNGKCWFVVVLCLSVLLLQAIPSQAETGNCIDDFVNWYYWYGNIFPVTAPEGNALHLWADVLPTGSPYDTGVTYSIIDGKVLVAWEDTATVPGPISFTMSAAKVNTTLAREPGRLHIMFTDILAPGYNYNNASTWRYMTLPAASVSVLFDSSQNCSGDTLGIDYASVGAYLDSHETGPIAVYTESGTYHFSHIDGIFELAFWTGFCENRIDNLILYDWGDSRIGDDVAVQCKDGTTGGPIATVTFSAVSATGKTSVASTTLGPAPPAGYLSGTPARFFSVDSLSAYSGTIEVCFKYGDVSYSSEAGLQLFHYDDGGAAWENITSTLDTTAKIVCGETDSLSTFAAFEPQASDSGGGGGGGGGGCFIATAAFGSYEEPHVRILREFRDNLLLTNTPGRWFVARYYEYSPNAARWLEANAWAKAPVRLALLPFIGLAWLALHAGVSAEALMILLLMVLATSCILGVRRRAQRA